MNRRPFKLTIKDKLLRTMNRKQYYAAMSWLRLCERRIHERIDYDKIHKEFLNMALYGCSEGNPT